MQLPKLVCEDCYDKGTVKSARIRVVRYGIEGQKNIYEYCTKHFYERNVHYLVSTSYSVSGKAVTPLPGIYWTKTIIELIQ
jgi:hypothetical protein